jgi:hypothetical protein
LKTILNRVTGIDGAPTIVDLDNDLTDEVFWAAGKQQLSSFLERLEGWWFRRVLKQLTERDGSFIGAVELESQMTDLRQQFHPDALPIDDDLLSYELDEATYELHKSSLFVKQLGLIKAGKKRVQNAIRDYFRAYEQRSRWLRNELIVEMELHKYEKRLVDEWSTFFEAVRDEIGDKATAEEKEKAARSVLQWAEQKIVPIRINVTEPFVSRGSFQMLAQDKRIWWHSDFLDRLSELLLPEEAKK